MPRITAAEAAAKSLGPEAELERIYDAIRSEASNNQFSILPRIQHSGTLETLLADGYEVVNLQHGSFRVSWAHLAIRPFSAEEAVANTRTPEDYSYETSLANVFSDIREATLRGRGNLVCFFTDREAAEVGVTLQQLGYRIERYSGDQALVSWGPEPPAEPETAEEEEELALFPFQAAFIDEPEEVDPEEEVKTLWNHLLEYD